jgi:hypothetical protein
VCKNVYIYTVERKARCECTQKKEKEEMAQYNKGGESRKPPTLLTNYTYNDVI